MKINKKYVNLLNKKKAKICIWGCGYIGYSTMSFFAKKKD